MEIVESARELFIAMLISASPLEMKVGIPFAINLDVDPILAYIFCCGANMLAFPISYWFFNKAHSGLFSRKWKYRRFSVKMNRKAKDKTGDLVDKYGYWGLLVFVAIPLPFTGAYMGTLAAWVFNIEPKQAYKSVAIGNLFAGVLVTIFAVGFKEGISLLS